MTPFETEIIEFDGCRVRIEYFVDEDSEPPWARSCGHGPVRIGSPRASLKRPGERVMNPSRRQNDSPYYYDWQEAVKIAKLDGWNAPPYDAPNQAERAAQADFEFLSGWVNGDWHYAGAVCTVVDKDGDVVKGRFGRYQDDCWGFDTATDYHKTAGREMADDLAKHYLDEVGEDEETRV